MTAIIAPPRPLRPRACSGIDGRCRLHDSYLYDAEIIPRVQKAILASGKFTDTSIWAVGQRRRLRLNGCVQTAEQAPEVEGP